MGTDAGPHVAAAGWYYWYYKHQSLAFQCQETSPVMIPSSDHLKEQADTLRPHTNAHHLRVTSSKAWLVVCITPQTGRASAFSSLPVSGIGYQGIQTQTHQMQLDNMRSLSKCVMQL